MSPKAPKKANTDKPVEPVVPITPDVAQTSELDLDAILAVTDTVDGMVATFQEDATITLLEDKIGKWVTAQNDIRNNADTITALEARIQNETQQLQNLEEAQVKVAEAIGKLKNGLESAGKQADKVAGAAEMKGKLEALEKGLPKIEATIAEKKDNLKTLKADLAKAQKETDKLNAALQDTEFDEIRATAEKTEKNLAELRKETFGALVTEAHEKASEAAKDASELSKRPGALLKVEIDEVKAKKAEADKLLGKALEDPTITSAKNGDGITEIEISDRIEQTLRRAAQFGMITNEEADQMRTAIDTFMDGLIESLSTIKSMNDQMRQLNARTSPNVRPARSKEQRSPRPARPAEGDKKRRVRSILSPEQEAKAKAMTDPETGRPKPKVKPAPAKGPAEAKNGTPQWMAALNSSKKQQELRGECDKYVQDQGTVKISMRDATNGQVEEGEFDAPQKGLFRIVIGSTPIGLVHVKLDATGNPTNEVIKVVTLQDIEQQARDIVTQNDIGNKGIFKDIYAQAVKSAGARAIAEAKRQKGKEAQLDKT